MPRAPKLHQPTLPRLRSYPSKETHEIINNNIPHPHIRQTLQIRYINHRSRIVLSHMRGDYQRIPDKRHASLLCRRIQKPNRSLPVSSMALCKFPLSTFVFLLNAISYSAASQITHNQLSSPAPELKALRPVPAKLDQLTSKTKAA